MIQQVTAFWSTPLATDFFKKTLQTRVLLLMLFLFGSVSMALAERGIRPDVANLPGDTIISATICANETYLFDGQLLDMEGEYAATYIASDGSDSTVTLQLTVLPLLHETVNAIICTGAVYTFFGLALNQTGQYDAVLTGSNGCDSTVTLNLTVLPLQVTNLSASICSETNFLFQGDTLTETGTYSMVLTNSNGCDSIVRLKLDVVDFFDIHQNAVICDGESYSFGDTIVSDAGVYVDSLIAIGGCDSVVTLTLTILPPLTSDLTVVICEGSSYVFQGETLSSADVYTFAVTGSFGCDSIITLNLEMVPFFETSLEATICKGETYTLGTQSLTDEGQYIETLTAVGGCDSILTLMLTVLPTSTGTDGATVCDGESVEYHGETLSEPGEYQFVLEGANGCDSTVTFTLTVLETPNTVMEAVICHGATYVFYGEILTDEGVYEEIFQAENGCDSTVSLILTVLPELNTAIEASICAGTTYDFNGEILGQSGSYSMILSSEFGCDSTVTLALTVLPVQSSTINAAICANEAYAFDGNLISDAGTYTAIFSDVNGCDSTVTLHLEVLPLLESNIEATICDGTSYPFNGISLTAAGDYAAIVTSSFGCDSTINLTLTVLPTYSSEFDASVCEGDGYDYLGQVLTDAGDYEFNLLGENGCDSIVTVHLTLLPLQHTPLDAAICEGEAYDYNGEMLSASGAYNFTFLAANGCDSIVTVNLVVHPVATTTLNVVECEGLTYDFNGMTLDVSGTYTADLTSQFGCDSTVVLNLEFVGFFETPLQATICAGATYSFGGDDLTDSGEYTMTLQAVGGCDSIVTLMLTVLPENTTETNVAICTGDSYAFNGALLTHEGTYTALFAGTNGCDSTSVLNLSLLPLSSAAVEATICANTTYSFDGNDLDASGVYTGVFTSANGCDSTVTLTLTVMPAITSAIEASICAGDFYDFDNVLILDEGTYTATFTAANGCDSIVVLTLTVLPLPQSVFAAIVCNGAPFEFNGEVLTESGVYTFVIDGAAQNGCDSMVVVYLTIFPAIPPTTIYATVCAGETYVFNGSAYDETGEYAFPLSSSTGCDSLVVLNLTVLPESMSAIVATICHGNSYAFNGQLLVDPGTYTATFQNSNGCDSVVVLTLMVETVTVTVALNNGTLTATSVNGMNYQWINCANNLPIPGANGSTYTPAVTGSYAVLATNANGCTSVSTCVTVMISSVRELFAASNWVLQPNPASTHTSIVLKETIASDVWLEVFDPSGRLLQQQAVAAGVTVVDLDISAFPDGILIVRLTGKEGVSTKLLMKGN